MWSFDVNVISQTFLKLIHLYEIYCVLIQISMKFVHKGPNYKTSTLVETMAWHRTSDIAQMMAQFTDSYLAIDDLIMFA